MKNMVKLVGIIAFVAVIGLGITACEEEVELVYPSTSGRLTVSGLGAYTGKWIGCEYYTLANGTYLMFGDSSNVGQPIGSTVYSQISQIQIPQSGSVTFYVWNNPTIGDITGYSGTNSNVHIQALIRDDSGYGGMVTASGGLMVNFTDGVASGTFYPNP